jgi:hypothetical protein
LISVRLIALEKHGEGRDEIETLLLNQVEGLKDNNRELQSRVDIVNRYIDILLTNSPRLDALASREDATRERVSHLEAPSPMLMDAQERLHALDGKGNGEIDPPAGPSITETTGNRLDALEKRAIDVGTHVHDDKGICCWIPPTPKPPTCCEGCLDFPCSHTTGVPDCESCKQMSKEGVKRSCYRKLTCCEGCVSEKSSGDNCGKLLDALRLPSGLLACYIDTSGCKGCVKKDTCDQSRSKVCNVGGNGKPVCYRKFTCGECRYAHWCASDSLGICLVYPGLQGFDWEKVEKNTTACPSFSPLECE